MSEKFSQEDNIETEPAENRVKKMFDKLKIEVNEILNLTNLHKNDATE